MADLRTINIWNKLSIDCVQEQNRQISLKGGLG